MDLLLGSAQWGWNMTEAAVFRMLDLWLQAGLKRIDCATNYPIDKVPANFRAAEGMLSTYIRAHGIHNELAITMKIGSLDNMKSPECNLSPSFIRMMAEEYNRIFGSALSCLMIHWDNRNEGNAIEETVEALYDCCHSLGLTPGLSGIAHPELYANLLQGPVDVQVKNNVFQSSIAHYLPLKNNGNLVQFFAYGINGGGVKLQENYTAESTLLIRGGHQEQVMQRVNAINQKIPQWNGNVRPPIKNMNHLGLIFNMLNPEISGIVLGVKNQAQFSETLDFIRNIQTYDYSDVWQWLRTHQ